MNEFGETAFYVEHGQVILGADHLNPGSARVLTRGTTKVACTAQVLDSLRGTPSFISTVSPFSAAGKH